MTCEECRKETAKLVRGFCAACYQRKRSNGELEMLVKSRPRECAACGEVKRVIAKGLRDGEKK